MLASERFIFHNFSLPSFSMEDVKTIVLCYVSTCFLQLYMLKKPSAQRVSTHLYQEHDWLRSSFFSDYGYKISFKLGKRFRVGAFQETTKNRYDFFPV